MKSLETAHRHVSVTPSDTASLSVAGELPRALRIGAAGDVSVTDQYETAIVYTCVTGEVLEVKAARVNSTSTTATGIVAWY
jgi:hypothetical protein